MKKLRTVVVHLLVVLFLAPRAHAQDSSDLWRSYAERLAPGSFVVVHLREGGNLEGRVIQVSTDTVTVLPKARLPVPPRALRFADIQSIDARTEGRSPGSKVLIGLGVAGSVLVVGLAVAIAGMK